MSDSSEGVYIVKLFLVRESFSNLISTSWVLLSADPINSKYQLDVNKIGSAGFNYNNHVHDIMLWIL